MTNLIDGRAIAEKVYVGLRRDIAELKAKGVAPGLAVILVGDNPPRAHVRSKDKMCRDLIVLSQMELPQRSPNPSCSRA
jgi:methylenetetrahydrofolate dehydrogenase (NADP+)/methenyltetrahydrofolate cyclohydrolase